MLKSRNIYEFDLKEFFDRVNPDFLSKKWQELGLPKELVYHMISWSRTMPVNMSNSTDLTWDTEKEYWSSFSQHLKISSEEFRAYSNQQKDGWNGKYCYFHGVSLPSSKEVRGGSPLSPTLSTLILVHTIIVRWMFFIFYADDLVTPSINEME